jgi:hypothetical protein
MPTTNLQRILDAELKTVVSAKIAGRSSRAVFPSSSNLKTKTPLACHLQKSGLLP